MEFPQLCGPAYQDSSPDIDLEDCINFYIEQVASGNSKNKSGYVMKRSPGLKLRYDPGSEAAVPGLFSLNGHVFGVIGGTVFDFVYNGSLLVVHAQYNAIATDGTPVEFAADPAGTQLGIYSAGHVYVLEGGALTEVTWPGVRLAGLALLNQYFLLLSAVGDGFFYSEPGDINAGDPLNFRTAEASANKYVSILIDHQQVWLHGNGNVTQVFFNDTADPNEPFKPNPSAVIPQGIGPAASAISFNNRVWWISPDGIAYRSDGYLPDEVSTSAITNIWRQYPTILDAVSWPATFNGHQMWRVWFPSGNETWEFDTSLPPGVGWRKVLGWDGNGNFTAHRGMSSCQAFGLQLVGDRSNGKIYSLEPSVYFDDGTRVPCERITPDVQQELHKIVFDYLKLDMQTGVGDGSNGDIALGDVTPEFEPTIEISYSTNSGRSWLTYLRSLGQQGDYKKEVYVNRFAGTATKMALKIRVTAGCPVNINTCYLGDPETEVS